MGIVISLSNLYRIIRIKHSFYSYQFIKPKQIVCYYRIACLFLQQRRCTLFELQNLPRTLSIYEINKRRSLQTLKKEYSSSLLSFINQYIRSPMQQIMWLKKIVILLHTIGAYPPHNMCGAFAHNVLSIKMYGKDL